MRRLVVRAQAELEIAAAKVIQENPYQYQAIEGEIRRAIMLPFPYSVVYLVTEADVAVVSCVHTSRDPKAWREHLR